MKFVRLGALFGSIVLLVATSITMIQKRSQLQSDLDSRVVAAAFVATESVQSTISRAVAVVDVASESSNVTNVSDNTIDSLVSSFEGAQACVVDASGERCTGPSLLGSDAFERGSQLSAEQEGQAVVVADEASDAVFVVAADTVTVALWLPLDTLVSNEANDSIAALDATTELSCDHVRRRGFGRPDVDRADVGRRVDRGDHIDGVPRRRGCGRGAEFRGRRRRSVRPQHRCLPRVARPRHAFSSRSPGARSSPSGVRSNGGPPPTT